MSTQCVSTHLIEGDGTLNFDGLENFTKKVKLAERGLSYAVISIMGPQSSGKSTLLNHLFRTNFKEMDETHGRSQTTLGIWLAKCAGIEPCTLVMDLEGNDGRERGENDVTFEKQIALFALAVSDIVLINMWCHDIGREQAANKPLLRIVFQAMTRLFKPRRSTLMFVIRDKTNTPLKKLEALLREDIQKIWDSVAKPQAQKGTSLDEFFRVEVVALPNYEYSQAEFKEEVAALRERFSRNGGSNSPLVPAPGFSLSVQEIWKTIKENKDLDVPTHMVMIAKIRCEEIAREKLESFALNEEWCQLSKAVRTQEVRGLGKKLGSLLDKCLLEYDAEAEYFDQDVRVSRREILKENLLQLIKPAYDSMLEHMSSKILKKFEVALDEALNAGKGIRVSACDCKESFITLFDEISEDAMIQQANWKSSGVKDKLLLQMDVYVTAIHATKLQELADKYKAKLKKAISRPVRERLHQAAADTWGSIRNLLEQQTKSTISEFGGALSDFNVDETTKAKMFTELEGFGKKVVEMKTKTEAEHILPLMKERFSYLLTRDSNGSRRVWSGNENIQEITKAAYSMCLKMLSVMVAIRLDNEGDNIEETLLGCLLDENPSNTALSSNNWDEVPSSVTLITPVQCMSLWRQLKDGTTELISLANKATETKVEKPNEFITILQLLVEAATTIVPVARLFL